MPPQCQQPTVARGIVLEKDAGAGPLKTHITLVLLRGPLVIIAIAAGKAADTVALTGVATTLVRFRSQQRKVKRAAVELGPVAAIAQLRVQKLLYLGRKRMLSVVRRRLQAQRPPCRRACRYCRSTRYNRARLSPSISQAWPSECSC
jgi:hypothetical protein